MTNSNLSFKVIYALRRMLPESSNINHPFRTSILYNLAPSGRCLKKNNSANSSTHIRQRNRKVVPGECDDNGKDNINLKARSQNTPIYTRSKNRSKKQDKTSRSHLFVLRLLIRKSFPSPIFMSPSH